MRALRYPATSKVKHVDTYHGVKVPDPYRWLEDERNPERSRWIIAQNALTAEYLKSIPYREELRTRFEELLRYPRYYNLYRRGPYLLYQKNEGLRSQLALYLQHGLTGASEVLVDPLALASDGTVRIATFGLSRDLKYLGYGLSERGSDMQEVRVKDVETGEEIDDRVQWVSGPPVAWCGQGFYYSGYGCLASDNRAIPVSAPSKYHRVWYHQMGTAQSADKLVFGDPEHPRRLHFVRTTEDERFVVISIVNYGEGHAGNSLYLIGIEEGDRVFRPLVTTFDNAFHVVDSLDGRLICVTDQGAANRRIVCIDPGRAHRRHWEELVAERNCALEQVAAIGGKLFAVYRQNATHRLFIISTKGTVEDEIPLPDVGLVHVYPGQPTDAEALWSFSNFTTPPTVYRYDLATRKSTTFLASALPFEPDNYGTSQVFYPSKDGTRIPMFLVHRRDLQLNEPRPCVLYGYGGFGTPLGPAFDPLLVALLERGVLFAVACLRGGGEYGEAWHRAGVRENKQIVFDDCIAAIEWLQAQGYTSSYRTALMGASNGGLLVGAVMTQRPEMVAVALPESAPMDMLRFHRFTLGHAWIAEYGSSENPAMFPILASYSPLHNIRRGVRYPATLVSTSEHDDRVVPAHSFKFIAALQANGARARPYLIRIETNSGHGAVSLPKELEQRADLYAFLLANLPGVTVSGSDVSGRARGAIGESSHQGVTACLWHERGEGEP